MNHTFFRRIGCGLALTLALSLALASGASQALEVEGVKLDDTVKVAGRDLKLNGAGVRVRAVFKVYVLGLYLAQKAGTAEAVLAAPGPRRFALTMLRDISGEDLGQAFITSINANTDKAEKSKIVNQMVRFGDMFVAVGGLKKGDVVTADWVPEQGTVIQINGRPIEAPFPDPTFYNALLKIWLGAKPADSSLKPLLLGGDG